MTQITPAPHHTPALPLSDQSAGVSDGQRCSPVPPEPRQGNNDETAADPPNASSEAVGRRGPSPLTTLSAAHSGLTQDMLY